MGEFKDFDAALREQRREPLRFRLGGEDFTASPRLAIGLLVEASVKGLSGQARLIGFIRDVLTDDDNRARLDALVQRKDIEVDISVIEDVVNWLVECYTARPTEEPSGSPESPPPTSESSSIDSLDLVTAESSA